MNRIPLSLLFMGGVLILAFQNFSHISRDQGVKDGSPSHSPSRMMQEPYLQYHVEQIVRQSDSLSSPHPVDLSLSPLQRLPEASFDIREIAPTPANEGNSASSIFAFHRSNSSLSDQNLDSADLKRAGSMILERQLRPSLQPIEEKLVRQFNRYLASFVPVEGDDWPSADGDQEGSKSDRSPSGQPAFPGLPTGFPGTPGGPDDGAESEDSDSFSWKEYRPKNLRFLKANEVTVGFAHRTELSCEISPNGSKFRVSRPLTATSSIDLNHETQGSRNSLGFKLSW